MVFEKESYASLGESDGDMLGNSDGDMLGSSDGEELGDFEEVGAPDGASLGESDGVLLGVFDGEELGVLHQERTLAREGGQAGHEPAEEHEPHRERVSRRVSLV